MRDKVRKYLVFTSKIYRVILVAVPIVILVLLGILDLKDYMITSVFAVVLYLAAEIMLDYWVFGGIATKGGTQLEYLKSSARGMEVMETGLWVNTIRQVITLGLIFLIGAVIFLAKGREMAMSAMWVARYIDMFLLGCFIIITALVIVRFFDGLYINFVVSCFAFFPVAGLIYLVAKNAYVMLPVLGILTVLVAIVGNHVIMKRIKESYYDETI